MATAMTFHATGRRLLSPVLICYGGKAVSYTALWDTGATESAVSERVAAEMELKPVCSVMRLTANGQRICNQYVVDMVLGSINLRNFAIHDIDNAQTDVIIGMDVIENGDLTISGQPDARVFTFRVPSKGVIDYFKADHSI